MEICKGRGLKTNQNNRDHGGLQRTVKAHVVICFDVSISVAQEPLLGPFVLPALSLQLVGLRAGGCRLQLASYFIFAKYWPGLLTSSPCKAGQLTLQHYERPLPVLFSPTHACPALHQSSCQVCAAWLDVQRSSQIFCHCHVSLTLTLGGYSSRKLSGNSSSRHTQTQCARDANRRLSSAIAWHLCGCAATP
jgi:hypothetical protein